MSYNLNKSECESVAKHYVNEKTKDALMAKEEILRNKVEVAYNSVFTPNLLQLLTTVHATNDRILNTSHSVAICATSRYDRISISFQDRKFGFSGRNEIEVTQPLFEEAKLAESAFKKLKQDVDTAKQTLSASLYKIKNIEKIEVQFPEIAETLKALKLDVKTKQSKLPSLIDKDVINNIEKLSKI